MDVQSVAYGIGMGIGLTVFFEILCLCILYIIRSLWVIYKSSKDKLD